MLGYRYNASATYTNKLYHPQITVDQLPTTVDWRSKGYVTPIKNQVCTATYSYLTERTKEERERERDRDRDRDRDRQTDRQLELELENLIFLGL